MRTCLSALLALAVCSACAARTARASGILPLESVRSPGERPCLKAFSDPFSPNPGLATPALPEEGFCAAPRARIADVLRSIRDDDADDDFSPVNPESRFLDRGRRDPWIAALASLVLPGAGQFYNSAAPHGFTLRGFDWWMYGQGGVHLLVAGLSVFHQLKGLQVQYAGGNVFVLGESDGQTWRAVHVINALVASVTAWLEADLINRIGRNYVMRMRMHAWFDPVGREACVCASLRF